MVQILKKICDHPLLLTKRAAEDVLEGMDSVDNPEDVHMAEKLANYIADVGDDNAFLEKHDSISCKISFIMSLLVSIYPLVSFIVPSCGILNFFILFMGTG